MKFNTSVLNNGIKLVHYQTNSPIAHCGITLNTGSRDELINEHGIAHFIEHLLFKGTKKRKAYHILSRMEDVGGEIDAYTTKEDTCVYSAFMPQYYYRTLDLLADIIFNSKFPEKEMAKEREVIIDEINSYKDNPTEMIFDEFEELLYPNHPFGRTILGTKKQLKKLNQNDIVNFVNRTYNTNQIVISSAGNIDFKKFEKIAKKNFDNISSNIRTFNRQNFEEITPFNIEHKKNISQSHCIIGSRAYSFNDNRRLALTLLSNLLGGSGMNSRLSLALREKHGFSYNIEANYSPYIDTGNVSIYFGTDKENIDKSISIIEKELKNLRTSKLGTLQLSKAKKQFIGQIAISAESNSNIMLSIGKSFLLEDKIDTVSDIIKLIENISADNIIEIANEIFDFQKMSKLTYLNK